jgi:hypothetical protein
MANTPKTVWLLEIWEAQTAQSVYSAHASRAGALRYLALYCRRQWQGQGGGAPLPAGDGPAVAAYFAYWQPEEVYELTELLLDPQQDEADTFTTAPAG